jgi:hypothetical protein
MQHIKSAALHLDWAPQAVQGQRIAQEATPFDTPHPGAHRNHLDDKINQHWFVDDDQITALAEQ